MLFSACPLSSSILHLANNVINLSSQGLGAEYLVWRISLNGDWVEGIENKWRISHFLFSILVATSVELAIQGNFLCLPMIAVSMFKLGFPG